MQAMSPSFVVLLAGSLAACTSASAAQTFSGYARSIDGDSLYVGGHFTNYCLGNTGSGHPFICSNPLSRRKAFEVQLSTGALTGWAPRFNSPHGVLCAVVDPVTHGLWTGGDFTKIGTKAVDHLADFRP